MVVNCEIIKKNCWAADQKQPNNWGNWEPAEK